jgi:hypothetical protein
LSVCLFAWYAGVEQPFCQFSFPCLFIAAPDVLRVRSVALQCAVVVISWILKLSLVVFTK